MKKNIDVFDFKEEDENAEFIAGKLLEKFRNPNPGNSPIMEHQCVLDFSQGNGIQKEELGNASCMDADVVESDNSCDDSPAFEAEAEDSRSSPAFQLNLRVHEQETDLNQVNHGAGRFSVEPGSKNFFNETSSPSQCHLNSSLSDSPSSQERVDMMSANDESLSDRSTLSPASNSAGDDDLLKDLIAEYCLDAVEKIDINAAVVLSPDYVVLQDRPCTAALVIFSCNGVIIRGHSANDEEGSFSYEWRVDDIVSIQYRWFQNVGLVILKLRVLLKDEKHDEDMQSTTEIEELKFAVAEQNWNEKQQKINLLNVKYSAVWSAELDGNMEVAGDNLSQQSHYFPSFDEPFEDVIYPKGDPDAVSICKRDVDLLQPETFVNDTIIDFYIKYLKNQIQTEEKHRFHFFNSFFFRKLADLDKDPSSIADGKAAFLRVRKWTRKVDIFEKDYIFIPVNFNLHWSLIVICHPGEVADYTDVDLDKSVRVPCILHMDSIRGSHAGLKNLVQTYLCEEWKERHKETPDDVSSKFLNLRFVSLELPQQENSFDCGLFLLHYLELFLAEAPQDFNPFKISKVSNFLYVDWFPSAEASLKRTLIQKLIFELLENRSREVSSEENHSSESPQKNENDTGIELLSERCSPSVACHRNLPQSQDGQGIEMTLLERSSMKNLHGVNDSGMVLRELFDPGVTTGSLLGQLQTLEEPSPFYHLNNDISPREQADEETGDQFMCLNSGESTFQRISEMEAPRGSFSFSHGDFGADTSWSLGISVPREQEVDAPSSSETSTSVSDALEDIGIVEGDSSGNAHDKETGESPATITRPEVFPTVAGSNADQENNSDDDNKEPSPTKDDLVAPSSQEVGADENHRSEHDIEMSENASDDVGDDGDRHRLTETDEEKPAKRPRLSPQEEIGDTTDGSLSKDSGL